jgi:hypothetical protein
MIKHLKQLFIISATIIVSIACAISAYAQNKVVVIPLEASSNSGVNKIITRATSFTFPANNGATGQYLQADIQCLAGELVMGGGYSLSNHVSTSSQPNVIVLESRPAASNGGVVADGATATGWYAGARRNVDTIATTVTVYVQCGSN